MRWFLFDRFTEFVSGQHAVTVRSISLSEEAIDEYVPGYPTYPSSLIVEGMAQTGGILCTQISDFEDRLVLAKIMKLEMFAEAIPGDLLTLRADISTFNADGAVVKGVVRRGDFILSKLELMFAILNDEKFQDVKLFEPAGLCRSLRVWKLFEVGVNPDGSPIKIPEFMLKAERSELSVS